MERVSANWSAIASEAFERHLNEQLQREHTMSEDEAIQRLRRLKQAADKGDPDRSEPFVAKGRHWAMSDARPEELERLEQYVEQRLRPGLRSDLSDQAAKLHLREVAIAVTNISDPRRGNEWKRFWLERCGLAGDKRPAASEVYSFCEGAVQFWREVKDKV